MTEQHRAQFGLLASSTGSALLMPAMGFLLGWPVPSGPALWAWLTCHTFVVSTWAWVARTGLEDKLIGPLWLAVLGVYLVIGPLATLLPPLLATGALLLLCTTAVCAIPEALSVERNLRSQGMDAVIGRRAVDQRRYSSLDTGAPATPGSVERLDEWEAQARAASNTLMADPAVREAVKASREIARRRSEEALPPLLLPPLGPSDMDFKKKTPTPPVPAYTPKSLEGRVYTPVPPAPRQRTPTPATTTTTETETAGPREEGKP